MLDDQRNLFSTFLVCRPLGVGSSYYRTIIKRILKCSLLSRAFQAFLSAAERQQAPIVVALIASSACWLRAQ